MPTEIQWTDETWNPLRGCTRVSPGCMNCYAERQAVRFAGEGMPYEGLVKVANAHPQWTGEIMFAQHKLDEPFRWRKPKRIFVNSMSDLFHEGASDDEINRIFAVMALCHWHKFQILTKRAERMLAYMSEPGRAADVISEMSRESFDEWTIKGRSGDLPDMASVGVDGQDNMRIRIKDFVWPPKNVWLGVSVENQKYANERIPLLLQTPAAVRFLSVEPMLDAVSVERYMWPTHWHWESKYGTPEQALAAGGYAEKKRQALVSAYAVFVDWVICGGESGPGARPFDPGWAESLMQECKSAGVPFFMKQMGSQQLHSPYKWKRPFTDRKGGDMNDWPEHLRVREFPA